MGSIASVPRPLGGAGGTRGVPSSSWDPAVFRPDHVVSCYSREIFSGERYETPVTSKPGNGFRKPDCGAWVRKLKSGDDVRDIFHNCGNLGCPVCMPGTITDKARDIESRFEHYEQAKTRENAVLITGEARHVKPRQFIFTISPSHQAELEAAVKRTIPGKWGPDHHAVFMDLIREEYSRGLKLSGLVGGVSVYHDARVQHPDTGSRQARGKHLVLMEAKCAGNMKDEDPAWKIYDHIRKQKDWERYYYFSPHFHAIAFGKAIDAAEFEELMPGWTYHNKGTVSNPGGLARYLMSHMAMIPDRKAISWFGRLSSKCLGREELRTYEREEVHPETGLPWIIIDSTIPGEVGGTYRVTVTEYRGFFRTDHKRKKRDPDAVIFRSSGKRSMAPPEVHVKGILALARYCDEWGKL